MLDVLMGELVSIREQTDRSIKGKPTYTELVVDDEPVRMRCRIERRTVRQYTQGRVEKTGDARMMWRLREDGIPKETHLIVTSRGEAYRIVELESHKPLGSNREYGRAVLRFSRDEVPATAHTGDE